MIVAVASGKGGTGKTTVSASLVSAWRHPVTAVDLDVEEPNLHLFLNPVMAGSRTAYMDVPEVDLNRCNHCGACSSICQFKAISVFGEAILSFPEMCHGCGACLAVCPENALRPGRRELGTIQWGTAGTAGFLMGELRVGEAMSPPLMRQVKHRLTERIAGTPTDVIIDAPPGVSCPAVNAVMDADVILLVTEPTPFGLYDLKLAVKAFAPLNRPMAVVVNRAGLGDTGVHDYCRAAQLAIIAEIPYDRAIAEAYARGKIPAVAFESLGSYFEGFSRDIRRWAKETDPEREACHG